MVKVKRKIGVCDFCRREKEVTLREEINRYLCDDCANREFVCTECESRKIKKVIFLSPHSYVAQCEECYNIR